MEPLYCVVYRTGGRVNYEWRRTLAMVHSAAVKAAEEILRGGRPALVVKYEQSLRIGLPDTFE